MKNQACLAFDSLSMSESILKRILKLGNFYHVIEDESGGLSLFEDNPHHLNLIRQAIRTNKPLHMILPAFPAKSPNSQKTLGHLPDYGEVLALTRLNDLCHEIETIYPQGAYLTICSDGRVFNDLVEVSDSHVNAYTHGVRNIIDSYQLTKLDTFSLEDVCPKASDFSEMRKWLVENYASSLESLRERNQSSQEFKFLFNGIHRFLVEDQVVLHPEISKNKLRERAKGLSYSVIQRSNAWSEVLEEAFPDSVRLSIHPQAASSKKLGIRLLDSNDIWRTPWHSVPLFDGVSYKLVSRKEAESSGASLNYTAGHACFIC